MSQSHAQQIIIIIDQVRYFHKTGSNVSNKFIFYSKILLQNNKRSERRKMDTEIKKGPNNKTDMLDTQNTPMPSISIHNKQTMLKLLNIY